MAMTWNPCKADISWLTDTLATGGDLQADHLQAATQCFDLIEQGVTHVIDCRDEFDDRARMKRFAPSISYSRFGVDDDYAVSHPGEWWEAIYQEAVEAFGVPDAKVVVHCHAGMNRGPSAAFMLLCSPLFHVQPLDAFILVRNQRPIAHMAYAEQAVAWMSTKGWLSGQKSVILELEKLRNGPLRWTQALSDEVNYRHQQKAGQQ